VDEYLLIYVPSMPSYLSLEIYVLISAYPNSDLADYTEFTFVYAVICESTCAKSTFTTTNEEHWNAMLSRASRLWIVRLSTRWLVHQSGTVDIALTAEQKQIVVFVVR